jgi:hypothetical protein
LREVAKKIETIKDKEAILKGSCPTNINRSQTTAAYKSAAVKIKI